MVNQDIPGLIANLRVRHDGWTPARQRTFLRALSETGCVRDACARAGISNTSAYRMKKRSAPFSRAWDRALAKAMPTIEQAAYERAVIGWEEPIVQGGKLVGHKRRYSDSLLRLLLQRGFGGEAGAKANGEAGDGAAMDGSPRPGDSRGTRIFIRCSQEETDAALEKKLAAVERRLRRKGKLPPLPES